MKNSSNRILTVAVVLLLLVNIALVVFMMQGRKKKGDKTHGKGEPFEMMVKELQMTPEQQTEYKSMKEEHMKTIRPLFDSVRAAKTSFFALTRQADVSDSVVNAFSQRITGHQAAIDKQTFAHFKRVRAIFTPAQQPKFDDFLQRMMQRRKDSSGKKERD